MGSLCPQLQRLMVPKGSSIKNLESVNLYKITLTHVSNIDDIAQLLLIPLLEVEIQFYGDIPDPDIDLVWCFTLLSTSSNLIIQSVTDVQYMSDYLEAYTGKFKEIVAAIKSIRDTPISIKSICEDFDTRKKRVCEIVFFLSQTGMFKAVEELEMAQEALKQ